MKNTDFRRDIKKQKERYIQESSSEEGGHFKHSNNYIHNHFFIEEEIKHDLNVSLPSIKRSQASSRMSQEANGILCWVLSVLNFLFRRGSWQNGAQ